MCSHFFSAKESIFRVKKSKEEVICRINPANSDLFAILIRVFEKGEAPMNENFRFLPRKWILWQKKMTARNVYFSAQGLKDLFPDPLI